jgi:nucleoside-diphosphate-sugar epimerase
MDSAIAAEREHLRRLADGEQRLIAVCEQYGISWTILRPTIIYAEGRDGNVSRLARLIQKFGFLPLMGNGAGLRQPVHAEDLAVGAIQEATSTAAVNKTYALPGGETISYREMVGRIFDAFGKPRRIISAPPIVWRAAFALAKPFFPNANAAMGSRMAMDMVFDGTPAARDFGWSPRGFRPKFNLAKVAGASNSAPTPASCSSFASAPIRASRGHDPHCPARPAYRWGAAEQGRPRRQS